MSEKYGPLPERKIRHTYNESKGYACDCWAEEEVIAYAERAVAAERERCAKLCEQARPKGGRMWDEPQAACFSALTHVAEAIRNA
jgi:hypothetical protein